MKIAAIHIPYNEDDDSFSTSSRDHTKRLSIANRVLKVTENHADLIAFPAGFLVCHNRHECNDVAKAFVNNLIPRHCVVVFGIDFRKDDVYTKAHNRHFFVYCIDHKNNHLLWNSMQLGTGSKSSRVPSKRINKRRVISIRGKKIGIILCGEMTTRVSDRLYKPRISKIISENSDVIVDIAHADRLNTKPPTRSWYKAMEDTGKPCILSEHIKRTNIGNNRFCKSKKDGPEYSKKAHLSDSISEHDYFIRIYDLN